MFTVFFAIPRTSGWLGQCQEMLDGGDQRISLPRQIHAGSNVRNYVPMAVRECGRAA